MNNFRKFIAFLLATVFIFMCSCSGSNNSDTNLTTDLVTSVEKINNVVTFNSTNDAICHEYFKIPVPSSWLNICYYVVSDDNTSIQVFMKTELSDNGAYLFGIVIDSLDDQDNVIADLDSGMVTPLRMLRTNSDDAYMIGYILASDMSCTEPEQEKFLQIENSIESVLECIISLNDSELLTWQDIYISNPSYGESYNPN